MKNFLQWMVIVLFVLGCLFLIFSINLGKSSAGYDFDFDKIFSTGNIIMTLIFFVVGYLVLLAYNSKDK